MGLNPGHAERGIEGNREAAAGAAEGDGATGGQRELKLHPGDGIVDPDPDWNARSGLHRAAHGDGH
jgi:hypothetical protein